MQRDSKNNILSLLKKLHALAEQGVGGEKDSAMRKLEHLMKKYNVSFDELDDNEARWTEVFVSGDQLQFSHQVHAHVTGLSSFRADAKHLRKNRKRISIEYKFTKAQYLEYKAKFDFYWAKYQEDLQLFYSAFIQKNGLFREINPDEEIKPLSEQDKVQLMKLMQMMEGLDKHRFHKQLEQSTK